jgi:hypothetical protein
MMIASTPWVVRSEMNGIWAAASAACGPTLVTGAPPSSVAALSTPVLAASKYLLTTSFGR